MNPRSLLVVSLVAVSVVGCDCRKSAALGVSGEVRWQWESASSLEGTPEGNIDFGTVTMGARVSRPIYVRNVGRAAFTMKEFAQLGGAAASFNVQGAPFEVYFQPEAVVQPTERTLVTVIFAPPLTDQDPTVDYAASLELRPQGASPSALTLNGRALAGQCQVPTEIDFGAVPLRTLATSSIDVRNDGAASVTVTAGGVTGVAVGVFEVTGITGGSLVVPPGAAPLLTVNFSPSIPGDFAGEFVMRRGESCPQRTVRIKGRGVESCLTWRADPAEDATGRTLHFGPVPLAGVGPGTVTFINQCSLQADLTWLRTSDPSFQLAAASQGDVSVPPASRDSAGAWVDGTAQASLEFRPTSLGLRTGNLLANTSLASQPQLAVPLKGFGGGPIIEVRPARLFPLGRIGYQPGSAPPNVVLRHLRISNVGNRPTPPDPRVNLYLGTGGMTPYWSVQAITGAASELCVGEYDVQTGACSNTLPAGLYDPAVGLEAVAGQGLDLPIRVIPSSPGAKEWALTIYSNDPANPAVTVRLTADAIVAPPCNYTVSPAQLAFGVMDVPQVSELTFTVTNLGTQASEVCYLNGLELSGSSHSTFSLPANPVDATLAAGQALTVRVRAQPLMTPPTVQQITGEVRFNMSSSAAPQVLVPLTATLAPSCLRVQPNPVSFRDTELECGSPEVAVTITNSCPNTVTLNTVTLTNSGLAPAGMNGCTTTGGCPQFVLASSPTLGQMLPGASRTALVRFRPYVLGANQGELTFTTQQGSQVVPYAIPMSGNGLVRTMAGCGVSVVCPNPMTVGANSTVTLAPSIMAPGTTTCSWTVGSRPTTSNGTFSAPTSCSSTTYFADVVGTHLVQFSVADGLGGSAQCTTPITVTPNGDLWIELTWDRNNDIDLHLLHPTGGPASSANSWGNGTWDCDYSNRTPNWLAGTQSNPTLDRDDITGMGPENTRINTPVPGTTYTIGVHMYSWSASPTPVLSTVKLYCGGQLVTTQTRSLSRLKDMWVVGTVTFGGTSPCAWSPNGLVINVP